MFTLLIKQHQHSVMMTLTGSGYLPTQDSHQGHSQPPYSHFVPLILLFYACIKHIYEKVRSNKLYL